MIKLKNLTVKNFMSVGNATQAINFDRNDLTLVLGENLDLGGDGERNGVGKTTLLNALSYGLYGQAISDIKLNNLVNKSNEKNMLVSIEFDIDQTEYRIERGRKPNLLKFYKDGIDQDDDDKDDTAQGENRETQKEIVHVLNSLSHDMFKHAVALNTYTEPFLSMRVSEQRNIIEQLLGITTLTEKAEALKINSKATKDDIKEEEYQLSALLKANAHIEEQIDSLKRRQRVWKISYNNTVSDLTDSIEKLMHVDIDVEIQIHADNVASKDEAKTKWYKLTDQAQVRHNIAMAEYVVENDDVSVHNAGISKHNAEIVDCNKWIANLEKDIKDYTRRVQTLQKDIDLLQDHKCHACGQDLHDEKQAENITAKQKDMEKFVNNIARANKHEDEYKLKLAGLGAPLEEQDIPEQPVQDEVDRIEPDIKDTFYKTVKEAHNHKSTLETLTAQLETAIDDTDPYAEQIGDMLETGIQEISYEVMNDLVELQDHQAFLLKLLTSKDSFIRRKIIEQNLNYLNNRLTHYLREIGLPHTVCFMSDLTVEITELGRDLDFDNLSRGERTRLIMSLSLAFRDVWESLYSHINLLFVDELVDNGLDTAGVEAAIKIMKRLARERGKSVWVVSHRDELISRVGNTMKVIKTGGYTEYAGMVE